MRVPSARAWRRRAIVAAVPAALAAASLAALAQPPAGNPPVPFWRQPQSPPSSPPATPAPGSPPAPRPPAAAPAPATPPVIARVGGRDITETDFDRLAQPYFQRLRRELGNGFDANLQRIATFNVLDELIRRELVALESQRQKIEVSQADVDALLKQDSFFLTNGRFDPAKFEGYKTNPGSNYLQVLPRLRELAAIAKVDEALRKRCTPTPAEVRREWSRRSDQVRLGLLPLLTRDMPLEPEATEAEWAAYYAAHPDQFERKARVRLRYARLPLPAEGDSTREPETAIALDRGRAIADSLRRGMLADSAAGLMDSGLFEIPGAFVPGLGRVPGLSDTLERIERDSTIRVVGPYPTRDAVVVGIVAERQPKRVPPMREVLADVKRRADAEKRRAANEAERRAYYEANRTRWRAARARLTRVTLDPSAIPVRSPSRPEAERWYAAHGRSLFGMPDSSTAWLPPLNDSLRVVAAERMALDQRRQRAAEAMARIATALGGARDARSLAKANGAVAETLSLVQRAGADSLFPAPLVDSLFASAAASVGTIQGPRAFGARWAVWRVDAVDTSYVPPYEAVRARADAEFGEERRRKDEAEAREYFDQHRAAFKTPVQYALDHVLVRIPPPDSVRIPEADLRRQYDANPQSFHEDEQLKARHILFMTRDGGPEVERRAKLRADSLLAAIRKDGGDFAELAKRFSQEPGAATSGGDLGWFGRGRMVKEFETAAWALRPGEISPVVKTQFGYHIIQLEDRRAARTKPFEEVRAGLRAQMAQARGDSSARRSAGALRRRLALGGDAAALARPHGGVTSAAPIAANEALPIVGFVPGLAQDLPRMTPGKWAPDAYRVGTGYLVVRLREKLPERPAEFEQVKAQALEETKNAKRRALLSRRVGAIREALAAGASLDSLATPYGGLRNTGYLNQSSAFVPLLGNEPRLLQRAFAMGTGDVSDTLEVAAGVVWLRVDEKKPGDPAAFKAAEAQLEGELTKKKYDEWLEARKKAVKIEILRPDLKGPRPPAFPTATMTAGG